jgi:ATP-dependent RNA helicase DDX27
MVPIEQGQSKGRRYALLIDWYTISCLTTLSIAEISKQQYEKGFVPSSKKGKDKQAVDENKPKRDKFSGLSRRAKRRKLAMEEDKESGDVGAISASIRSAKKAGRPARIGEPERRAPTKRDKKRDRKSKAKKAVRVSRAGFDQELGHKKGTLNEGVRAKRGDAIGGMGKKGKKPKATGKAR